MRPVCECGENSYFVRPCMFRFEDVTRELQDVTQPCALAGRNEQCTDQLAELGLSDSLDPSQSLKSLFSNEEVRAALYLSDLSHFIWRYNIYWSATFEMRQRLLPLSGLTSLIMKARTSHGFARNCL